MEIQVVVKMNLGTQSINKKDGGTMDKASFVGETLGQYPKMLKFDVMGEKLEQIMANSRVNSTVTVSFDIESREWQGRWYTDLKAWRVAPIQQSGNATTQVPSPIPNAQEAPIDNQGGGEEENHDDLPF